MKSKEFTIKYNEEVEKDGKIEIVEKSYGPIVLKKYNYQEKCDLKGKILTIGIDQIGRETQEVNTSALFFWTVVFSIKSLPKYPDFWQLSEEKKSDIVKYLGCGDNEPETLGEEIWERAKEFNQVNSVDLKKKSS